MTKILKTFNRITNHWLQKNVVLAYLDMCFVFWYFSSKLEFVNHFLTKENH